MEQQQRGQLRLTAAQAPVLAVQRVPLSLTMKGHAMRCERPPLGYGWTHAFMSFMPMSTRAWMGSRRQGSSS